MARSLELPVLGGNRVELLQGRQQGWARVFDAIAHARDHVNLEGPLPVGATFDTWLERLATACRGGARVHLMLEGSSAAAKAVAPRLRRVGIRVGEPAPVESAWAWWHEGLESGSSPRTLAVIDGRIGFVGVLEPRPDDEGARRGARSCVVPRLACVEGPAVAELQWMFVDTWTQRIEGPMPGGRSFPPLPWVGPHRVGIAPGGSDWASSRVRRALLGALDAAQDRALLIGAAAPARALEAAVGAACARGVDVHVLLADDGHRFRLQRRAEMVLRRAGAHVHLLRAPLAAACSVIDGVWSSITLGRARSSSLARGDEDHLIVLDAAFAADAEQAFWADVQRCTPAPFGSWALPGAMQRLNQRLSRYLEVGW